MGRKHFILQLRQCASCGIKYRFPKDTPSTSTAYYQSAYAEPSVTELPTAPELARLLQSDFRGSPFDKSDKADLVADYVGSVEQTRLLDYGASWGYFMAQLRNRGFRHIVGFEVSVRRAHFGRAALGLEILTDEEDVRCRGPYEVICVAHVLEHLTEPARVLANLGRLLRRPGGMLHIWTPNASRAALDRWHGGTWSPLVGEPHTLAYDYAFFERALPQFGLRIRERGPESEPELRIVAEAAS